MNKAKIEILIDLDKTGYLPTIDLNLVLSDFLDDFGRKKMGENKWWFDQTAIRFVKPERKA